MKNISKRLGYLQYLDVLLVAQTGPVHEELSKEVRLGKDFEVYVWCSHLETILTYIILQLYQNIARLLTQLYEAYATSC
jgi:hypothetical protein